MSGRATLAVASMATLVAAWLGTLIGGTLDHGSLSAVQWRSGERHHRIFQREIDERRRLNTTECVDDVRVEIEARGVR